MDKEQIRIAVLEELGYVKISDGDESNYPKWKHNSWDCYECEQRNLLDHTRSLDACQEMLADLKDEELHIFDKHLAEIPHVGYSWLAKPIDLCVAFLKTRTDFKNARQNGVGARKDVGVLIYYDDYDEVAHFSFYWGGVGYHDDRILDFYYDTDEIAEKYYDTDDDKYEKALDEIFNFNMAESMENNYSINKGFEETVQFFEKEEVGWKWIHADRYLLKD